LRPETISATVARWIAARVVGPDNMAPTTATATGTTAVPAITARRPLTPAAVAAAFELVLLRAAHAPAAANSDPVPSLLVRRVRVWRGASRAVPANPTHPADLALNEVLRRLLVVASTAEAGRAPDNGPAAAPDPAHAVTAVSAPALDRRTEPAPSRLRRPQDAPAPAAPDETQSVARVGGAEAGADEVECALGRSAA